MEYTMRSCVYNTTVNNAMPVSVLSLLLLSHSGAEDRTFATGVLAGGKQNRKGVEKTDGVKPTLH